MVLFAVLVSIATVVADAQPANPFHVFVVIDKGADDHRLLLSTLQREIGVLSTKNRRIQLRTVTVDALDEISRQDGAIDLLVTVGTVATLETAKLDTGIALLSVLIPRVSYASIKEDYLRGNGRTGRKARVIYLDQPFTRRFKLTRELLPEATDIAVLLGPSTLGQKQALETAAKKYKFKLNIEVIEKDTQLLFALERVLKKSQVLLAILDPLVFNRANAQTVLLTSYRYRVPIIGISPAYTNAGALAAVYSTPEQIGKQVAEVIQKMAEKGNGTLPMAEYPEFFSVKINKHIAYSLGVKATDEKTLERLLQDGRQ